MHVEEDMLLITCKCQCLFCIILENINIFMLFLQTFNLNVTLITYRYSSSYIINQIKKRLYVNYVCM